MICGHGFIDAELVQANQNMPTGSATAPVIINSNRVSWGRPSLMLGDNQVLVVEDMSTPAMMMPIKSEMSGRLAEVGFHPRS